MGGRKTGGGWRSGETGVECRCLGVAWSSGVVLYGPMQSRGVTLVLYAVSRPRDLQFSPVDPSTPPDRPSRPLGLNARPSRQD